MKESKGASAKKGETKNGSDSRRKVRRGVPGRAETSSQMADTLASNREPSVPIEPVLRDLVDFPGSPGMAEDVYTLSWLYVHPLDPDCPDLAGLPLLLLAV